MIWSDLRHHHSLVPDEQHRLSFAGGYTNANTLEEARGSQRNGALERKTKPPSVRPRDKG